VDFEKLGAFYLGREVEPEGHRLTEQALLYDANDLTTHAVIVGMTGSGKTGLGIDLIEEAAMDGVPVLAIDPKGDLTNLALAFPELRAEDFEPWVDGGEAERRGLTRAAYAAAQAQAWREGLASWGMQPERIARLRDAADLRIYTPGSSAGRPLSVLRSFAAPGTAVLADADLLGERLETTVTALLTLLDLDADPLTSRDHILLSTLLEHAWRQGRDLGIADLIQAVQRPPVRTIGVMDLDTVYPPKDRMGLALRLNNLLAAPGFEVWTQGDPLDLQALLFRASGRGRVVVLSIAHLSDAERTFFLSLLLNEVVAWTRAQQGTSSLRALVYVDELVGLMPPVAQPPTKKPLLTLLKQARAFGVGLALATQNPVDLDYKGLSNAGSWFIGRLQTERDKARVMDGLSSAASGAADPDALDALISGLPKRTFLLHNVHEKQPVLFQTRWAMSYLAGPLAREQLRRLPEAQAGAAMAGAGADGPAAAAGGMAQASGAGDAGPAAGAGGLHPVADTAAPGPAASVPSPASAAATTRPFPSEPTGRAPVLPPDVPQLFAPLDGPSEGAHYLLHVAGVADVAYSQQTLGVDEQRTIARLVEPVDGPVPVTWAEGHEVALELNTLERQPRPDLGFGALPDVTLDGAAVKEWSRLFERHIRTAEGLTLLRCTAPKLLSRVGESERDFRVRCAQAAREVRDGQREKLRERFESKMATLSDRLSRAELTVQREAQQAGQRKVDAAISVGTALLGSFLGRRGVAASRVSTALNNVNRIPEEAADAQRARETAERIRSQLADLQGELERELAELDLPDADALELEPVRVLAKSTGIATRYVGLLWIPFRRDADGSWQAATTFALHAS